MNQLQFPVHSRGFLAQGKFLVRMVKPRRAFYNALTLAAVVTLTVGCGKPTPPPPGRRRYASGGRRAWR